MTPEEHRAQVEAVRASELRSPSSAEAHGVYPIRTPRGTDSREVSREIVPGAALAAAVLHIFTTTRH